MIYAFGSSVALALVMTFGDVLWSVLQLRNRVATGVAHGAAVCLCLGLAIGIRAGRPLPAAVAGPVVGALGALTFYALAPSLGWLALFPAWMLLWIMFALLQHWLVRRETIAAALGRGVAAALLSGAAFYVVSGIWTQERGAPDLARHLASWTFAFLPGFVCLFWRR
jgi:hypothetical protein